MRLSRIICRTMLGLLLGACADTATQPSEPMASSGDFALTGTPGTSAQILTRLASHLCMDVTGGTATAGARVALRACTTGSNQRFTWQSNGEIRVFGTMCLDAYGGKGRDGDPIVAWQCTGNSNQRWVATAAGEIKGINGKCMDVWGGKGNAGDAVTLYGCHGGTNQKWDNSPGSTGIAITPASASLGVGQTLQLQVRDGNGAVVSGATVVWSSSASSVVTVASSGLVTAIKAGTAAIRATSAGLSATANLTVTPSPTTQRTLFGVHDDVASLGWTWQRAPAIQRAKTINAKIARSSLMWNNIERQKGTRDWSVPDAGISDLTAAGIEPLMTIWGSPSWANGVSTSTSEAYKYVPTDPVLFRTWLDGYKAFVREAVLRYKGRVHKWELWNEPNEHWCWKPAPDVDRYVAWYREIYQTIKAVDPSAEVALGGLTGLTASGSQDINGKRFLELVYAKGVYPDIVAIHPYALAGQAPDVTLAYENNFTDIAKIYGVMKANGQGDKQIWATEWGWSVGGSISEQKQAEYVGKALNMLATLYPYVTVSTYFLDIDTDRYHQGLFALDGRMRPSGTRFRDFAAGR
jgi:hypothetical protein